MRLFIGLFLLCTTLTIGASAHAGWLDKILGRSTAVTTPQTAAAEQLIDSALKSWHGPKDIDTLMQFYSEHQLPADNTILASLYAPDPELLIFALQDAIWKRFEANLDFATQRTLIALAFVNSSLISSEGTPIPANFLFRVLKESKNNEIRRLASNILSRFDSEFGAGLPGHQSERSRVNKLLSKETDPVVLENLKLILAGRSAPSVPFPISDTCVDRLTKGIRDEESP